MHELPLVFFTLFTAASVGTTFNFVLANQSFKFEEQFKLYFYAILVLVVAGLCAFTHLGQPQRPFNVIFGLAHLSPMSLEILSVGIYGGILSVMMLFNFKYKEFKYCGKEKLVKISYPVLFCGALLAGLSVPNAYYFDTVKYWYNGWTWYNYLMSIMVLGFAFYEIFNLVMYREFKLSKQKVAAISVIYVASAVYYYLTVSGQLVIDPNDFQYLWMYKVKCVLASLFLVLSLVSFALKDKFVKTVFIIQASFVIFAELFGRIFFYELIMLRVL